MCVVSWGTQMGIVQRDMKQALVGGPLLISFNKACFISLWTIPICVPQDATHIAEVTEFFISECNSDSISVYPLELPTTLQRFLHFHRHLGPHILQVLKLFWKSYFTRLPTWFPSKIPIDSVMKPKGKLCT